MAVVTLDQDMNNEPIRINVKCDFTENSIAKTIIGHYFSKNKNCWTYPFNLQTFDEIEMRFPEAASEETMIIVNEVRKKNESMLDIKKTEDFKLTSKLSTYLYNYQRVAVKFMSELERVLLADDMGIGKTLESICTCEEQDESSDDRNLRILVVCPNSLKWTWADEIEFWKSKVDTYDAETTSRVINGTPKQKAKVWAKSAKYTIINYESLVNSPEVYFKDPVSVQSKIAARNKKREESGLPPKKGKIYEEEAADKEWDILIIDEAHRIKNRKSMYTQAVHALKASRIIEVTGTPILNRIDELWSLLHRLYPKRYSSYWNFVNTYCELVETPFGKKITGAKNLDELQKELAPIMIRRIKEEVISDLPDKSYQKIMVEMTPVQKKLYNEMKSGMISFYMKSIHNVDEKTLVEQVKSGRMAEKVVIQYGIDPEEDNFIGSKELEKSLLEKELKNLKEKFVVFDTRDDDLSSITPPPDMKDPDNFDPQYENIKQKLQEFRNRDERIAILVGHSNKYKDAMDKVGKMSASTMLAQNTRLRQIAISAGLIASDYKADAPKIDTLMDILPDYLESGKKAVVMTQFAQALELLKPRLDEAGIKYVALTGAVDIPDRQKMVKQFQQDDETKLFLCTIKAGGVGITLTRASSIFFLDRDWTPAMNEQAEDRLHRTGQKDNVLVVDLIAKNTVEAYVWQLLREKQDLFDAVVDMKTIIDALKASGDAS